MEPESGTFPSENQCSTATSTFQFVRFSSATACFVLCSSARRFAGVAWPAQHASTHEAPVTLWKFFTALSWAAREIRPCAIPNIVHVRSGLPATAFRPCTYRHVDGAPQVLLGGGQVLCGGTPGRLGCVWSLRGGQAAMMEFGWGNLPTRLRPRAAG